jgi:hypothetical protein
MKKFLIFLILFLGCSSPSKYGGWQTKKVTAKYWVHQTNDGATVIIMAEDGSLAAIPEPRYDHTKIGSDTRRQWDEPEKVEDK